jgi:hypothetical protein
MCYAGWFLPVLKHVRVCIQCYCVAYHRCDFVCIVTIKINATKNVRMKQNSRCFICMERYFLQRCFVFHVPWPNWCSKEHNYWWHFETKHKDLMKLNKSERQLKAISVLQSISAQQNIFSKFVSHIWLKKWAWNFLEKTAVSEQSFSKDQFIKKCLLIAASCFTSVQRKKTCLIVSVYHEWPRSGK